MKVRNIGLQAVNVCGKILRPYSPVEIDEAAWAAWLERADWNREIAEKYLRIEEPVQAAPVAEPEPASQDAEPEEAKPDGEDAGGDADPEAGEPASQDASDQEADAPQTDADDKPAPKKTGRKTSGRRNSRTGEGKVSGTGRRRGRGAGKAD